MRKKRTHKNAEKKDIKKTVLIFARLDTSYVVQDGSLNANVLSVSCRFSVGIEGVSQPSGVLSIIIDRFE